jgi:transglutaminase-like putative cysteine protease
MTDSTPLPTAGPAVTQGRRLRVRHLTRFTYLGPVVDSFNETRLRPVSDEWQTCESFALRLDPEAATRDYLDFSRNLVLYFEVVRPHERLDIEAVSVVQKRPDGRPAPGPVPRAALDDPAVGVAHFDFLGDTGYVPLAVPLRHEARQVIGDEVLDLWRDAVRLGEHVHGMMAYVPNATKVNTRVLDVLATRRGVCQDYAHVLLGLCRTMGIPARYVSGYFFNPARSPDQLEASHAWVEIFIPGYGWRGYDPTHRREPDVNYVKLATGRDYADIRPVSGTYRGRGTREMQVEVQVRLAE